MAYQQSWETSTGSSHCAHEHLVLVPGLGTSTNTLYSLPVARECFASKTQTRD